MSTPVRVLSTSAALALAMVAGQFIPPANAAQCDTIAGAQLLVNGGFERSSAPEGWARMQSGTNYVIVSGGAHDGGKYLRANNGTAGLGSSVSQDVSYSSTAGDSFVASVWVRSDTTTGNGRLVLWGLGGSGNEGTATAFTATTSWQQVQVALDTTLAHTALRLEFYMDSNIQYAFDGATLTRLVALPPGPACTGVDDATIVGSGSGTMDVTSLMGQFSATGGSYGKYSVGSNGCTTFTAWFIGTQTDLRYGNGNGGDVAANLVRANPGRGLTITHTPRVGAIFSSRDSAWLARSLCEGQKCGHTGLVVGISGNQVTILNTISDMASKPPYAKLNVIVWNSSQQVDFVYVGDHL